MPQRPLFVLSAGRTGSTLIARLLNRHPEILCVSDLFEPVGEVPYFDRDQIVTGDELFAVLSAPSFPQRIAYWREHWNAELLFLPDDDRLVSLLLSYTLPFVSDDPMGLFDELRAACREKEPDTMPSSLLWFFDWLRDRVGKRFWVERTGGSLPHTREIVELWPTGRFVHSYRDPREIAISMLSGSFFRLYLELSKNPDLGEWDWSYTPPVEELGAMIDRWICDAEEALATLPAEQLHTITFEDLTSRPEPSLLNLVTFLLGRDEPTRTDHEWAGAQAREVRQSSRRFRQLPRSTRQRLTDAVALSLDRLGYSP